MALSLKVNGRTHTLDVDPATPLLYVLSDDLELRGPKFGCGQARCGSCTVLVNGRAIRSCVTPVGSVAGAEVDDPRRPRHAREPPSRSRRRSSRSRPRQCGFCLNGVILTAKALLDREPEGERRADPGGAVGRALPLLRARPHACAPSSATRGSGRGETTAEPVAARLPEGLGRARRRLQRGRDRGQLAGARPRPRARRRPGDQLDSWIAIAEDGRVTAYTGKCELGQGLYTAQTQLIAEELVVPLDRVTLVQCDTDRTPDQGTTSGAQSHPANFNRANLALAAATAREALVRLASERLGAARGRSSRSRTASSRRRAIRRGR